VDYLVRGRGGRWRGLAARHRGERRLAGREELNGLPPRPHQVANALTLALELAHELAWLVEVDLLVQNREVFRMPRW
jgi:hypothetical protein